MKLLILMCLSLNYSAHAFTDRGMIEEGYEWRECSMGGTVIKCRLEECTAKCNEIIEQEKEQKVEETEDRIREEIREEQAPDKNPALYQLDQ